MNIPVFFDERWIGPHGIGRFASMLAERIPLQPLGIKGKPSHPIDPLRLASALFPKSGPGLFFSPGYNAPLFCKIPFVFCIHDLCPLDCPESFSRLRAAFLNTVTKPACHRASAVITVSDFSKQRIIRWSGLAPEKIVVAGNAVASSFNPGGEGHSHHAPYLLAVSNRRPHKNDARLIAAFANARSISDTHLLITGNPTRQLNALVRRLRIVTRVHFTGRVSDRELAALYRGALGAVLPSLYEGFGIPVLEAMACGTPVLTSSTTSLPEVAGDAALLVDPTSIDEITEGITRITTDSGLRESLRDAGLRRANRFSWDSIASRVQEALAISAVHSA